MNKTIIISALSIVIILITLPLNVNAQNLDAVNHEITLTTQDDENIGIKEYIILKSNTNESIFTIDFWIQNGANNVQILVNNTIYTYLKDETRYSINISTLELKIGEQILVEIIYILDKNIKNFEKKILQKTDSIIVKHDNKIITSCVDIALGTQLTIPIYKTVETPRESLFIYYIIIIVLLVVIIIFIYSLRFRKTSKIKEITSLTEEVLTTKKSLLMSLLKDLEKQYRAKEISDDTYHKLKEQYKQETVETMKKLDDMMKSKV